MATHILTEHDARQTISVAVGDVMQLEIEEPSTTGYRWIIQTPDRTIVELVEATLTPHVGIGAGGLRKFTFAAKSPGQTLLRLKLWREWEGDRSISKWFQIEFVVQKSTKS